MMSLYLEDINKEFNDKYENIKANINIKSKKPMEENLNDFIMKNKNKITETLNKIYEDEVELKKAFYLKNIRTKNRWINDELKKEDSALNDIINKATFLYELQTEMNNTVFEDTYNQKDVQSLRKEYELKLKQWKINDKYFLDYPFFQYKTRKAINTAIINDIVVFILNKNEEEQRNKQRDVIKVPYILKDIPEDTTNKIKINVQQQQLEFNEINAEIYKDFNKQEEVNLIIGKNDYLALYNNSKEEEIDKSIMFEILKNIKIFNSLDREILQYILQQQEEIYKEYKITRDISEIVIGTGRKNSKKIREEVEKSLYKLGSSGFSKDGEFVGRFFSLKLEKKKVVNGYKKIAHIYIDGMLREIMIKRNTLNFYADKFKLLSKDSQKILISIQDERIRKTLKEEELIVRKDIEEFNSIIYFKNKRTIKERIKKSLDELIDNKIAIKNYKFVSKYELEIEYYPFKDEDINVITKDNFVYGDLIDEGF